MSRELKRVPMTFSWPLHRVWEGYVNPYREFVDRCHACRGTGYSPPARRFFDEWYGRIAFDPVAYGVEPIKRDHPGLRAMAEHNVGHTNGGVDREAVDREATQLFDFLVRGHWCHHLNQADVDALVAADRLWDLTRVPRTSEQAAALEAQVAAGGSGHWLDEPNGHHPTAAEVNDLYLTGFGHDALNASVCVRARCEREGVPVKCQTCGGSGRWFGDVARADLVRIIGARRSCDCSPIGEMFGTIVPAETIETLYDEWERYEPPTGPGYQLWETCSEGSPISPVFASLDELCEWAESNATTFGSHRATRERWREMLDAGLVYHEEWTPSGIRVFL